MLKLYNKKMETMQVFHKMSQDEVVHCFTPVENLIWTYVVENEVDGKLMVTDFWHLKRSTNIVLDKLSQHADIKQAYLQLFALTVNNYEDMLKTLMYTARDEMECDSLSMLTIMENDPRVLTNN